VLAGFIIGYDTAECRGTNTFNYTASCQSVCSDTDDGNTRSVDVGSQVTCTLYMDPSCVGDDSQAVKTGCTDVTLSSVGSYACSVEC